MTADSETTKWMVIENIATLAATAAVVSAGYYFGIGTFALFGLLILININAPLTKQKF